MQHDFISNIQHTKTIRPTHIHEYILKTPVMCSQQLYVPPLMNKSFSCFISGHQMANSTGCEMENLKKSPAGQCFIKKPFLFCFFTINELLFNLLNYQLIKSLYNKIFFSVTISSRIDLK